MWKLREASSISRSRTRIHILHSRPQLVLLYITHETTYDANALVQKILALRCSGEGSHETEADDTLR